MSRQHQSVLLNEALSYLNVEAGQTYVDATFGAGGHTSAMLERGAKVIAFDFDESAVKDGQERFASEIATHQLRIVRENFDQLAKVVKNIQLETGSFSPIAGILFDFGTSLDQLKDTEKGFSFESANNPNSELDMRMDERLGVKAKDLLMVLPAKELEQMFRDFGGEEKAWAIAKKIVSLRSTNPAKLQTAQGLLQIIMSIKQRHDSHLHPATKVFQALRIAVNDELNNISRALPQALEIVKPGGKIVTIAFHEGEDRIAKSTFNSWEAKNLGRKLEKKSVKPSEQEIINNPRSRSAKLRAFEKDN
ncbi:MAG: 16S rRNA (cytosine(1402)-N(4))-methyltransferase RsmH [Patescibacteria group bacterium]